MNLPKGFLANAVSCGIKKNNKFDLAIFYSLAPAVTAAAFTTNYVKAAPIKLSIKNLKNNTAQAIIVNSGNANCFTGKAGIKDAQSMVDVTAERLGIQKNNCIVAATGIIGKRLPIDKIKNAIPVLVEGLNNSSVNFKKVSEAILTTDTKIKISSKKIKLDNNIVSIVGTAKGAGMIAPFMRTAKHATMLCFILTDAAIRADALKIAVDDCVDYSFNCITIDGCMSTNDMVTVLANGLAKNAILTKNSSDFIIFKKALCEVMLDLAKQIVQDAEGATKFIEIKIINSKSNSEAKKAALAVANSALFKTAMYGQNPNLGRIVSAIGQAQVKFNEEGIKIKTSSLKRKKINIEVDLGAGNKSAYVYTSDLTPEYIRINAEYS